MNYSKDKGSNMEPKSGSDANTIKSNPLLPPKRISESTLRRLRVVIAEHRPEQTSPKPA